MESKMYLLLLFLINLSFLPIPTTAKANITAVFAFGDSILDAGNNNVLSTLFKSNHAPYGRDFPGRIPSGRCSNGKLATDFFVSQLGIKELLPAYLDRACTDRDLLTGASFASAGSGLDNLTASAVRVLTMGQQLTYFHQALDRMRRTAGSQEADRIVKNALFIIAAGTNDMIDNFYGPLPVRRMYSLSQYHDFLLRNLEAVLKGLHDMGARRLAVLGLPPIGCLPVQVSINSIMPSPHMLQRLCENQQNTDCQAYNRKLQALVSRLRQTLPGSRVAYVDIYNPLMDMITRPKSYGFDRTLEGCCGLGVVEMGPLCNELDPMCRDPSRYLFFDAVHPTEKAYKILAQQLQQKLLPILGA